MINHDAEAVKVLLKTISLKRKKLDSYKPFSPQIVKNIDDWLRIELTYNSNALEGNTLTRLDTALVVEKGITAQGKSLVEHQEAINHARAFDYIVELIQSNTKISLKQLVFDIHTLILDKIDDDYKGRYRNVAVRIRASSTILPSPMKVSEKMEEMYKNLDERQSLSTPEKAIIAHFEFVSIHPFVDGNGRTARLIANYILMRGGYPPALIRKEERKIYLDSLEQYQVFGKSEKYYVFMLRAVERGIEEYLKWFEKQVVDKGKKLLKIGELARVANVTIASIRHWSEIGLLEIQSHTPGGYALYSEAMIKRIEEIIELQGQGFNLKSIRLKILSK